jgi:hypothetical protein
MNKPPVFSIPPSYTSVGDRATPKGSYIYSDRE